MTLTDDMEDLFRKYHGKMPAVPGVSPALMRTVVKAYYYNGFCDRALSSSQQQLDKLKWWSGFSLGMGGGVLALTLIDILARLVCRML